MAVSNAIAVAYMKMYHWPRDVIELMKQTRRILSMKSD